MQNCENKLRVKMFLSFIGIHYLHPHVLAIYKAKKINYMFLRYCPRHFQPPPVQNFIVFLVFALKNCLDIINCQFNWKLVDAISFVLVRWLIFSAPNSSST